MHVFVASKMKIFGIDKLKKLLRAGGVPKDELFQGQKSGFKVRNRAWGYEKEPKRTWRCFLNHDGPAVSYVPL